MNGDRTIDDQIKAPAAQLAEEGPKKEPGIAKMIRSVEQRSTNSPVHKALRPVKLITMLPWRLGDRNSAMSISATIKWLSNSAA